MPLLVLENFMMTFHFCHRKRTIVTLAECFASLSYCKVMHRPFSFEIFGCMWAVMMLLYTSKFVLLLLSAVTSSVKTSEQFLWRLYIPMSPWFTDEVLCFGPWVVSFFLLTFLIPSVHKTLSEMSPAFLFSFSELLFDLCSTGFCS